MTWDSSDLFLIAIEIQPRLAAETSTRGAIAFALRYRSTLAGPGLAVYDHVDRWPDQFTLAGALPLSPSAAFFLNGKESGCPDSPAADLCPQHIAVLTSGGIDSAVLVADLASAGHAVFPIYIRCGFAWESTELAATFRFLDHLDLPSVRDLAVLDLPVADLLPTHWSTASAPVPDAASPDEAVYLPARNVLLLAKSVLWCHLNGVPAIALAVLKGNPFPDATPSFFSAYENVLNQALDANVQIHRPYAQLDKIQVLKRGASFPLQHTFSCIHPIEGLHCGACNKCAERQKGFHLAGLHDPTPYAVSRNQIPV